MLQVNAWSLGTGSPPNLTLEIRPMSSVRISMPSGTESFSSFIPELFFASFLSADKAVFRNPAWQSALGSDENPWLHLSEDDQTLARQYVTEAIAGCLVTNQVFSASVVGRDEPLPVLLNFFPVHLPGADNEPTVCAATVTGEALTEPSSWTSSQTQRHRMETLGRMTMGIAHDFNNLLSAVLWHIELMKAETSQAQKDLTFAEHLRTIEQAALDGANLIRKIQQYVRQEKQTHFEPVDLPTVIRDCVALTRPYWYNEPRRQGIAIETSLQLGEVPAVSASPTELREVFINLILNAVQAMPRGGMLSFDTNFLAEKGVCVSVTDTGIGMSESTRARIFEPLFTTKGPHGTGMGLAVSYGILQEHDATISVASRLGDGTRFEIFFPPAETSTWETVQLIERVAATPARIMIVDDEPMVRTALARLLALKGHTVRQAASGAEALALANTEQFDIVFTDHGMPEMSGIELARALRLRNPALPIALLTGDTEYGRHNNCVDLVLSKPFQLRELEAAITKLRRS